MCFKFTTRSRLLRESEIAHLERSANTDRVNAISQWKKAGWLNHAMRGFSPESVYYKEKELQMNIHQSSAREYVKYYQQTQMLVKQLKSRL